MRPYVPVIAILAVAALSHAACGSDANAPQPNAITLPSPFIAQVEGRWSGDATLRLPVAGTLTDLGECVQADVNARLTAGVLADHVVLSMSQKGADVTAQANSISTGLACRYTGTAATTTFALNAAECDAPLLVVRCSQGVARDLKLVGSFVSATVDPQTRTITGTLSNTYNAFVTGTDEGVAGLVLTYNYTARKQ